MSDGLSIDAPAKVNLHLRVFPRAADGFHPLRSWFAVTRLADRLRVEVDDAAAGEADGCLLECDDAGLSAGPDNLVRRAIAALRRDGVDLPPLRFHLHKRVPAGGGLGGGSGDAAAALALAGKLGVPHDDLRQIAPRVGSDVPFLLAHHLDGIEQATVTGRGEIVGPIGEPRRHAILLILPPFGVSTPAAFRAFDALPPPADDGEPDFAAWSRLPAADLAPLLRNDLEPAAFAVALPLRALLHDCKRRLGRPIRLSGSGSTLFALYDHPAEATAAALALDLPTHVA